MPQAKVVTRLDQKGLIVHKISVIRRFPLAQVCHVTVHEGFGTLAVLERRRDWGDLGFYKLFDALPLLVL